MTGQVTVLRGDARALPLRDESIDLCICSPPYYGLRSYSAGLGEIGSEPHWQDWLTALLDATREMVRVLKPTGSMFIDLGDKYSERTGGKHHSSDGYVGRGQQAGILGQTRGPMEKSLLLLPERYRVACVDQLGLIARAVIVWDKPNGLPESVRDRVRRSHEDWVHLVKQPRYYAALDEIRESSGADRRPGIGGAWMSGNVAPMSNQDGRGRLNQYSNSLGKLPGSVWNIPSEPLRLPPWIDTQHYACVDAETEILTRRGWLRHDQLEFGEEVAGFNLDIGAAEWTRLHGLFAYPHDGEMVAVEKRDLSMRLTTNHRTIVQQDHYRPRRFGPIKVITADQLGPRHFIPRSAEWVPDMQAKSIGRDLAALCGWVAAEGWHHGQSVYLSQSKTANADKVIVIDGLIGSLHYTPTAWGQRWRYLVATYRTERQRMWRGEPWVEVQWRLPLGLSQRIRQLMPEKLLTAELANLIEDEAQALLDAFIDADGHRRPDGRIGIFQKDRTNLDWLQMIAVRLGYKTTLRRGSDKWALYLTKGGRPITLRSTDGVNKPIPREHYQGIVWCPQTGTGTFIARRNGSVFITGNSFPTEWPRRLILAFSPPGVCVACGQGRWPVVDRQYEQLRPGDQPGRASLNGEGIHGPDRRAGTHIKAEATILGYACACTPHTNHPGIGESSGPSHNRTDHRVEEGYANTAMGLGKPGLGARPRVGPWREYHLNGWQPPPTTPAIILDPFSGTGCTMHVAAALGRIGVGVDLSEAYCRVAKDRTLTRQRADKVHGRRNLELQGVLL